VNVLLELETSPDVDIPSKVEEVSQAARELVESRMGLRVANLKVLVKHSTQARAASRAPVVPSVPAPTVAAETLVEAPPVVDSAAGNGGPNAQL
jgi:hypothetical protein